MSPSPALGIPFAKYHALGNDFLVLDAKHLARGRKSLAAFVRAICDRHYGVGADGVVLHDSPRGRHRMRIFNADGSEAEISGNGLRILAHHLYCLGLAKEREFAIRSATAENHVFVQGRKSPLMHIRAAMAVPELRARMIPLRTRSRFFISQEFKVAAGALLGTAVSVGNPHIVFFVDRFDFDWRSFGREVESDRRFPKRVNVEFARIINRRRVEVRIWERGVGETSASGTGASAVVAAGIANGWLDHSVTVVAPAGALQVAIPSLDQPIQLTGPSQFVAAGEFVLTRR